MPRAKHATSSFFLVFVIFLLLPFSESLANNFSGSEHIRIGDQVKLRFCANCEPETTPLFKLSNGLQLSYGQINALGGDYYGDPVNPISSCKTKQQQFEIFQQNIQQLYAGKTAEIEVPQLLAVMQLEFEAVERAEKNNQEPSVELQKLGNTLAKQFNVITGGGSKASVWVPFGRYLELAQNNRDHFVPDAWTTYAVGHEIALITAVKAGKSQNTELLKFAYFQNAFADHFLEDQFAAGHLRVPRVDLPKNVTPEILGNYLTFYMHAEDNHFGLNVSNANGDHWTTYGDERYLDSINTTTHKMVNQAIQLSADEVFQAYLTGAYPEPDNFAAHKFVPIANSVESAGTSPMFLNGTQRRSDLNHLQDYNWTEDWNGFSTLIMLETIYGPADGPSVAELMG